MMLTEKKAHLVIASAFHISAFSEKKPKEQESNFRKMHTNVKNGVFAAA